MMARLKIGRWRFALTFGHFGVCWERQAPGAGCVAFKFFCLTYLRRRGHQP